MTITAYWREFLTSPVPLELSVTEQCDNGCRYCFSVLNRKHVASARKSLSSQSSAETVLSFLTDYKNRDTLEAKLLKDGYPVLLSNRTDPFSRGNCDVTIPVLRMMRELGIDAAIQTKGFVVASDFEQVTEILKPSCWYISIAVSEDVRKLIEPFAPPISNRLALISKLRELGHSVIVGVSPYVPQWLPYPQEFIADLKVRGCQGIWIEPLQLNKDQAAQLTNKDRECLTPDIIKTAQIDPPEKRSDYQSFVHFRQAVVDSGMPVFSIGQSNSSEIWDNFRRHYPRTFPTHQDFVNLLHRHNIPSNTAIPFNSFWDAFGSMLPATQQRAVQCSVTLDHSVSDNRELRLKQRGNVNYEQLCRTSWGDDRVKFSPCRNRALNLAVEYDGREYHQLLNKVDRLPLLAWNPAGTDNVYSVIGRDDGCFQNGHVRHDRQTKDVMITGSVCVHSVTGLIEGKNARLL